MLTKIERSYRKKMGYLITGGTGFIGAYITRLLIQEGEEVVVYDVDPRQDLLEHLMGKEESDRIKVIRGDITDLAYLIRTAQECNVTKLIHMAALLTTESLANPALAVRINCDGTANILETARILSLKKVVYASSATVFGLPEKYEQEYIPNDAPHYPTTIYAACKSFNERLAEHYFREYGVDSVGLRFATVYGVGQRSGVSTRRTEELVVKPALGKPGVVPHGDATIHWLYVEDAARAAVMTSKKPTTETRAFNIDGDIRSVAEAADCIRKLIPGADIKLLPGYIGFAVKYDITRIREEIGYHPQWPIERGMKKIIDEVRK